MIHQNGDYYLGNFEHGIASGKGFFRRMSGETYEGDWENNLPNGVGKSITE